MSYDFRTVARWVLLPVIVVIALAIVYAASSEIKPGRLEQIRLHNTESLAHEKTRQIEALVAASQNGSSPELLAQMAYSISGVKPPERASVEAVMQVPCEGNDKEMMESLPVHHKDRNQDLVLGFGCAAVVFVEHVPRVSVTENYLVSFEVSPGHYLQCGTMNFPGKTHGDDCTALFTSKKGRKATVFNFSQRPLTFH